MATEIPYFIDFFRVKPASEAQHIMRDLPKSVFSTPGMTALHPAGAVPEANKTYGLLQMAWVARTAAIALSRVPCFGHMTTKLKGTGEPYRGACLVVTFLFAEHKPDHVLAVFVWIIGKEDPGGGEPQLVHRRYGHARGMQRRSRKCP